MADAAYFAPEVFNGEHGHGGEGASGTAADVHENVSQAAEAIRNNVSTNPTFYACDIWSLGLIILEMASGDAPFPQMKELQIFNALSEGERPPIPDRIPLPIAKIVRACLKDEPAERPTARQLLKLLVSARIELNVPIANNCTNTSDTKVDGAAANPTTTNTTKPNNLMSSLFGGGSTTTTTTSPPSPGNSKPSAQKSNLMSLFSKP